MTDAAPRRPTLRRGRSTSELIAELQRIVQALEAGNLPLEESIELYRRGLELHASVRGSAARRGADHRAARPRPDRGAVPAETEGGRVVAVAVAIRAPRDGDLVAMADQAGQLAATRWSRRSCAAGWRRGGH